jgi:hypothetical protein
MANGGKTHTEMPEHLRQSNSTEVAGTPGSSCNFARAFLMMSLQAALSPSGKHNPGQPRGGLRFRTTYAVLGCWLFTSELLGQWRPDLQSSGASLDEQRRS